VLHLPVSFFLPVLIIKNDIFTTLHQYTTCDLVRVDNIMEGCFCKKNEILGIEMRCMFYAVINISFLINYLSFGSTVYKIFIPLVIFL